MKNKSAAVIPARGIGDALLMMIASHHLLKSGYTVTTFHPRLKQLRRFFPYHHFAETPPEDLSEFDLVIFENDNSARIKKLLRGSIFYPSYKLHKHGILAPLDQVFDSRLPMADNIAHAIANLLQLPGISKDNGFMPPPELIHRKHEKRVVIHPFSSHEDKTWPKQKFLKIAERLKKKGFEPVFTMTSEEAKQWSLCPFPTFAFSSLDAFACFLYESGYLIGNDSLPGHLASNMHLPTLIIADDASRMKLWRPAWRQGVVLTPSRLIPRKIRKKYWKQWISPRKVLASFSLLI